MKKLSGNKFFSHLPLIALTCFSVAFSFYLMTRTFGYKADKHVIVIAPKLWSDFGAHIPLIRSFSMGANFDRLIHLKPVESPLFPGEPIRYHFGFYAIAGILEKLGVRIDWALNIPSIIGFFLLMMTIVWFSWELFGSIAISTLSLLFFLCNGTLSAITFFQKHPLSSAIWPEITKASRFAVFGPWDGQDITAFWSLNIYTNQRHLALSYAIVLGMLAYLLHIKKKPHHTNHKISRWAVSPGFRQAFSYAMVIGAMAAFLFFINFAAASIAGLFLIWFFLVNKHVRLPLFLSILIVGPAYLALHQVSNVTSNIVFEPGYLAHPPFTIKSLSWFWLQNLGLHIVLIPLGFVLVPKHIKKLLIVPLVILFAAPNFFRFSSDMINNHKFFNFFIIVGGMLSAYVIVSIARFVHKKHMILRTISYTIVGVVTMCLTLSGVIDFFPIINDAEGGLTDYMANPDSMYILKNTPKDAIFADSYWFYHPANLVGRPVYSGYTYFTFSYGYDQGGREKRLIDVYQAHNQEQVCQLLQEDHISYVELVPTPEGYLKPNTDLWESLPPDYDNPTSHLKIFSTSTICP